MSSACDPSVRFDVLPLTGFTVVEFGTYLVAPLVCRHLQHLGARVIAVTRPKSGEDTEAEWRPQTRRALQEGKQLIELDLKTAAGRQSARALILKHADVVVENFDPKTRVKLGIDAETLRKDKPSLIHLSMPGFASNDANFADCPAWEAIILAQAGVFRDMGVNRQLMKIPASYSPLPLASSYGSVLGALAVTAALHRRALAVAAGIAPLAAPGESIEVPLASALLDTLVHNSLEFDCPDRYMSARQRFLAAAETCTDTKAKMREMQYEDLEELMDPFYNSYRCSDGRPFYLVAPSHIRHQQNALRVLGLESDVAKIGIPLAKPYSHDGELVHGIGAGQVGDSWVVPLRKLMRRAFLKRTALEWEMLFGEAQVPGAAHRTTLEWLKSPHAQAAGLVQTSADGFMQPGPAAWVREELCLSDDGDNAENKDETESNTTVDTSDSIQTINNTDEHQNAKINTQDKFNSSSWMCGVRVLDLTNVIAGPTIGTYLARFGAEVTHVAPPEPMYSPETTVMYGMATNVGKRSIILDVKSEEGKAGLHKLVAQSDVVVVNCTPSCLARLGLDPQSLRRINRRAVLVRFDAWGGPNEGQGIRADHLGYDDNMQAAQGIMHRFGGGLGRVEEHAHIGTIDVVAGIGGALAAAAALVHSVRNAKHIRGILVARASLASLGQIVQFPFCCGTSATLEVEAAACQSRFGPQCRGEHALLRCYEAGDGQWLMLAGGLVAPKKLNDSRICKLASADPLLADAISSLSELSDGNFDFALTEALTEVFQLPGGTADQWVSKLLKDGVAAARLRSLNEVREANTVTNPDFHNGPTFQFATEQDHPIGGPVTMFAPCSVRAPSGHMPLPLSPAPRYGQHTREVLREVGINPEPLFESGVTVEEWSPEYLPGFIRVPVLEKRLSTGNIDGVNSCPICLLTQENAGSMLQLSCGHCLCNCCAERCSSFGHEGCPLCRHPHLLDPAILAQRSAQWREAYSSFRRGSSKGAAGELSSIGRPREKGGFMQKWSASAGDLFELMPQTESSTSAK
eukprot:TRINITY_DN6396_c0_g1_i4.p1 TRINITY_DN6396_c0_g1~~TRINITY_DN6396_c0_g1_i4.p1  ORF type:complete len:1029 (-),score=186.45 TRINITY_DN6396_c0_g1_i4:249-3335(-)